MVVVAKWLAKYMLRHDDRFRTHGRPIRYPELQSVGMRVRRLEDDPALQDAVLSVFHANEITFNGPTGKIIENHVGRRWVLVEQTIALQPAIPSGHQPPRGQQPGL